MGICTRWKSARGLAIKCERYRNPCKWQNGWIYPWCSWSQAIRCHWCSCLGPCMWAPSQFLTSKDVRIIPDISMLVPLALAEASSQLLYIAACLDLSVMKVCQGHQLSCGSGFRLLKGFPCPSRHWKVWEIVHFPRQCSEILEWVEGLPAPSVLTKPSSLFMAFAAYVEYVPFVLLCSVLCPLGHREICCTRSRDQDIQF